MWAWAMYDWANAGFCTLVQTFVFAAYFTRSVAADEAAGTAMWGNMMGLAGLFIGIGGPVLGAVADRSGRRKPWIAAFTILCVASTLLLWFVKPEPSWAIYALLLAGIGTIGSEYANIFYNAMLPDLAPPQAMGRWSGWGWGMGYAGGLFCLVIALYGFVGQGALFQISHDQALHVRATLILSALWYLFFSLPMFLHTPDTASSRIAPRQALKQAIKQLKSSIREVRSYRDIMIFLLARMLYNDGLTTMFAFGGIYAAGTFGMEPGEVIMFGIGLNVTAGLGAAGFAWLDDRFGPRQVILFSLAGLVIPGIIILVAKSRLLFWIFGLLLGIFVGPVQASSRTWLAHTAPKELRTQMFGLFALSGKLTSFAGPLLVGWITFATGSQRTGMGAIIALFAAGFALMLAVPKVRQ